ncbi:hypothetical protein CXG81DRAFT_17957 [Caulochytrium protostelioides]|uniref:Uncharacterized protein n=1 Tax=Caulochytrium protostelioides TaxID=1555241 RepID=A0A4P9XAK2_9FUNG|nr:hypothetical protein CXG81DRAFT_17957 [Caulochytrium protostelioides]|eukprot:RKP02362.1 hypothetical protein CXG81DRAFT_17957 [Caulochytrium protostelioides]
MRQASPAPPRRLRIDLAPGQRAGPFVLGQSLVRTLAILRQHPKRYRAPIELKYDPDEPFRHDVIVHLPGPGLCLRYDAATQTLVQIELYRLDRLHATLLGRDLATARHVPTFVALHQLMGPTYPGTYHAASERYALDHPGIRLVFPVPKAYAPAPGAPALPLTFPDGTTPVLSRVVLMRPATTPRTATAAPSPPHHPHHPHPPEQRIQTPPLPPLPPPPPPPPGHDAVDVEALSGEGLIIRPAGHRVGFNTPAQAVLAMLGPPEATLVKTDHGVGVHTAAVMAAQAARQATPPRELAGLAPPPAPPPPAPAPQGLTTATYGPDDYFWNYFGYGIDLLFDGARHTVKTIVLHTNLPGHGHFGLYHPCPFRFRDLTSQATLADIAHVFGQPDDSPAAARGGPPDAPPVARAVQPVLFNRHPPTNPFSQATEFYHFDGMVFEILPNRHIASLTLF